MESLYAESTEYVRVFYLTEQGTAAIAWYVLVTTYFVLNMEQNKFFECTWKTNHCKDKGRFQTVTSDPSNI